MARVDAFPTATEDLLERPARGANEDSHDHPGRGRRED